MFSWQRSIGAFKCMVMLPSVVRLIKGQHNCKRWRNREYNFINHSINQSIQISDFIVSGLSSLNLWDTSHMLSQSLEVISFAIAYVLSVRVQFPDPESFASPDTYQYEDMQTVQTVSV